MRNTSHPHEGAPRGICRTCGGYADEPQHDGYTLLNWKQAGLADE